MRAESGNEHEEGAGWRLSLLALSTLMYFPYSTETHIAKRGKAGGSGGCTACVCVLDRGKRGGYWRERQRERGSHINCCVRTLVSCCKRRRRRRFLSRRTLTFVSDI